ncbi:hypothetical protein Misp05_16240 [Micromonospora sp. NBRC 107095]|nr:hypothetical protein Misp05_16240 [Micromonospora sp. NBRC 107095]
MAAVWLIAADPGTSLVRIAILPSTYLTGALRRRVAIRFVAAPGAAPADKQSGVHDSLVRGFGADVVGESRRLGRPERVAVVMSQTIQLQR